MSNKTLLVAKREFLQIAKTRSFWLTLLILPVMIIAMPIIASFMRTDIPQGYAVADLTGRYAAAIEARMERGHQGEILNDFAGWAQRWSLKPRNGTAVWADGPREFTDAEIDAFAAAGGYKAAIADIGPLPARTPPFVAVARQTFLTPLPKDIPTTWGPEMFGKAAAKYVHASRSRTVKPLRAVVYIPADYGQPGGGGAKVWTNGGNSFLAGEVRNELREDARAATAKTLGLDAAAAERLDAAQGAVEVITPPRGKGRDGVAIQALIPLGMSYFLLMAVFVSGAWLLQGVLEEKANKLLEAVLACISPAQLMHGKLIGIVGVGLTVIIVWVSCILGATVFLTGGIGESIKPALASLQSPLLPLALIFYFLCGYVMIAMIYLAIGSVSESMADAQGYLTPVALLLFMPFWALSQLISNPDALVAKVLSWIPLYTPFAMMARMGSGVEPWEVIGTTVFMLAFMALEFWLLGRLFRASVLRTGQAPRFSEFAKLMFKPVSQ